MEFCKNLDVDLHTTEWNMSLLSTIPLGCQYKELQNNIKLNNKNLLTRGSMKSFYHSFKTSELVNYTQYGLYFQQNIIVN
jgi:hypothetical protein